MEGPLLTPARVRDIREQGPRYIGVAIERPTAPGTIALMNRHTLPGQYVWVAPGAHEPANGFALARGPNPARGYLELLVARDSHGGRALASLAPGASLAVSDPEGKGYDVAGVLGRDLLLFSAGSGIAPLRALLDVVIARRADFGRVRLFHGQSKRRDVPYADWFDSLADHSVSFELALSQPSNAWTGHTGYVQSLADRDDLFADPERISVFVCGMQAMEQAVTELVTGRGVSAEHVFKNQ